MSLKGIDSISSEDLITMSESLIDDTSSETDVNSNQSEAATRMAEQLKRISSMNKGALRISTNSSNNVRSNDMRKKATSAVYHKRKASHEEAKLRKEMERLAARLVDVLDARGRELKRHKKEMARLQVDELNHNMRRGNSNGNMPSNVTQLQQELQRVAGKLVSVLSEVRN